MFSVVEWMIVGAVVVVWLVVTALAVGHAIMYRRDPRSTLIWMWVSLALPIVGAWLYWVLGINRIERKAIRLGKREKPFETFDRSHVDAASDHHREAVGHLVSLRKIADRVTRMPLLSGNAIEPLHNGEQAYPRMLEAIGRAERSITLVSYIFDWDDVGHEFVAALDAAAERGVRVHVLVDGVGVLGSFSRMGRLLLQSGAEVAAFFPVRFPWGRIRLNLRNHRKILVVDGKVGFTGGMNISSRYLIESGSADRVEDLHFELTGPVVAEMQHAFAEDWALATGEVLQGEAYFPRLMPVGPALCRGISSGPDEDFEDIHWILQAALTSADFDLQIATPYFIPTSALVTGMVMAALRGVRIRLVLPSLVDYRFMRWAADAYLWQLLEHGIEVYRRPPPFVHTKLLIADRRWLLFGSANLDPRSFRLNFEFNVEAYDAVLADRLSAWLDERIAESQCVTLDQMDSRPTWRRLRDGVAKVFSPYL